MEIKDRISFLKKHENDCYSICYYLLQSEKMACEAAKKALYSLSRCDSFFAENTQAVRELVRKEAMKSALQLKKEQADLLLL
ncbi:hypothetical protein EXW96_10570 [Paenibacillus sp. JMULE4]|uniref:hypothetical protein n=1 Tax=Paenibacillus TaxID=44249 RepID=UPI00087EA840|nr:MULTISPECIES: hypothetical protein [Paenibacillus]NTZ17995.1 hypothetical protein [Paenibacillus sp. JMULE4]SDJ88772.1 hypothetical protein SAMN05421868_1539 [Paenibacillus naphthalenovorans]